MKKKLFLFLCVFTLLLSSAAHAEEAIAVETQSTSAAAQTFSPFVRTRHYSGFSDVSADAWYQPYVASLYEYGLTTGVGGGRYAPDASVTLAELITFSARLNAAYTGAALPDARSGDAWYQPYVTYLKDAELLGNEFDGQFDSAATRAQMAGIFASTLPAEWYDGRNADTVTGGYARREYITDVNDYTPYQPQILYLYKQGVIGGTDASGSFRPDAPLRRSEVAALLVRMVEPDARITLNWRAQPYRSAVGTTWTMLTSAPTSVTAAPASDDDAAIDALVRRMLTEEASVISLQYKSGVDAKESSELARVFIAAVKRYCEQMYNSVTCRTYSSGKVELRFSSTVCNDTQLAAYRENTLARAILIHDALWESGYLDASMSEYELARAYYVWLCDNCVYDESSVSSDSPSHLAYSALVDGVAVCDGYTGAYNLLLKLEGIECSALFNDEHIWTLATLDGVRYHIDTTWGDRGSRADMSCFGMNETQSRALHAW